MSLVHHSGYSASISLSGYGQVNQTTGSIGEVLVSSCLRRSNDSVVSMALRYVIARSNILLTQFS